MMQEELILLQRARMLEQEALDAEYQLRAAEARFEDLKVRLQSQFLNQRAVAASVQAEFSQARLQAEADQDLHSQGLIGDLTLKLSQVRSEELAIRFSDTLERGLAIGEPGDLALQVIVLFGAVLASFALRRAWNRAVERRISAADEGSPGASFCGHRNASSSL